MEEGTSDVPVYLDNDAVLIKWTTLDTNTWSVVMNEIY